MSKASGSASLERKWVVLRRILSVPHACTFADLGYICGPETIRTMAANGLIEVQITIKPKGKAEYDRGVLLRKKRERKLHLARLKNLPDASVDVSTSCVPSDVNGVPHKVEAA